jgi:hypothetical protein
MAGHQPNIGGLIRRPQLPSDKEGSIHGNIDVIGRVLRRNKLPARNIQK